MTFHLRRCIALLALLVAAVSTTAGEIQRAKVQHKDGIYILELKVVLASPFEPVHSIITNHAELHRISEMLLETSLISNTDTDIKRRLVMRTCILIFCFTTTMVENVLETDTAVLTRIVPGQSDYKYGETEWQVNAIDADHSSIEIYCELEPGFWIPPAIGPFLLKRKMMSEARKTIDRIEELAING